MLGHRALSPYLVALSVTIAALPAVAGEVEVRLKASPGVVAHEDARLKAVERSAGEEISWPLAGATLLLPEEGDWQLTCHGEGVWCPSLDGSERVDLPVFPALEVRARLVMPKGEVPPESGVVQGSFLDSEGREVELLAPLSVDEGAISFIAPRREMDFRLAFPGWVPVYFWGVSPPTEATARSLDLTDLTLHRGSSLAGWVLRIEDRVPVSGATVSLSPLGTEVTRTSLLTATQASDDNGFFQIVGIEPGRYQLKATAEGRAPMVHSGLDVAPDSEVLLGALPLSPPLTIRVAVDPPLHPSGERWRLRFSPVRGSSGEEPTDVTVAADGAVEVNGLQPGEHFVRVLSAGRDGSDHVVHFESVEIEAEAWLPLVVPLVEVKGRLRLGGEPLSASVRLEGGAGDSVSLESGEDGELSGWMRKPRRNWLIATVTWSESGELRRQRIEVEPPAPEDGALEIEIDLPVGVIVGEVVDPDGDSRPGVRVEAMPVGRAGGQFATTEVRSDRQGRFHLTGLESRRFHVRAFNNGGDASQVAEVDLRDGLPPAPLRLVLQPGSRLDGRLMTAQGTAVAGAMIDFQTFGPNPVSTGGQSGADGSFFVHLPADVDRSVVTVFAPSHSLWSACLEVSVDEPLVLHMPPSSGALRVTIRGRDALPPATGGRLVAVTADGGFVEWGVLANWRRAVSPSTGLAGFLHSGDARSVELPALAAGSYGLLWSAAPSWELARAACLGAVRDVDWISLLPGGSADLLIDLSEQQRRR